MKRPRQIEDDEESNYKRHKADSEQSHSSEEPDDCKGGPKWTSLEHRGVTFFPGYQPHGVSLLYKGKPLEVRPEVEEVCNWWAQCLGTEFIEKELVVKNFTDNFLKLFPKDLGATSLADFDFSRIKEHLEQAKEARNNRPAEDKKRDQQEKQEQDARYRTCLFNQQQEKVSNFVVEPPGIFRGRGQHPHAGCFKSRIVPEYVILNIGQQNPIPACPIPGHSWKQVKENQEATWLAHFRDERSSFAPGKYVFLAADSKVKGDNDQKKYERARRLKACIKSVRDAYQRKMNSDDLTENQLGVCSYLIDKLALRVGNEKGEDEADTVGCCSLRVEHVRFEVDCQVTFDFLGKDSMRYLNTIHVEPIVYKLLQTFTSSKKPDADIFDRINPAKLNEFLKNFMEDLSAKVFRTYNASYTLQQELQKADGDIKDSDNADVKVKLYNDCNRTVAILCNHQKSVSKNHEEQMTKMQEVLKDKRFKLKMLEEMRKALKAGKEPAAGSADLRKFVKEQGAPKTLEQC